MGVNREMVIIKLFIKILDFENVTTFVDENGIPLIFLRNRRFVMVIDSYVESQSVEEAGILHVYIV